MTLRSGMIGRNHVPVAGFWNVNLAWKKRADL